MTLTPVTLEGQQYYSAHDLKNVYKTYFLGTSRTTRLIITKKNISPNNYIFAIHTAKNGWVVSDESTKRAKVLLKKEFCEANILSPPSSPKRPNTPVKKPSSPIAKPVRNDDLQMAPPILHLDEEEMFKDEDGNILEIEVRGEKEEDKIFFYCKDVAEKFGIPSLNRNILAEHTSYIRNEDFVLFGRDSTMYTQPIKTLFLTYQGLLKVLFVSRNKNANSFRKWASKTLFTIQMGTQEQKDRLGAKIQNINYQDFSNVFRKHANKLSAIYLIKVGTVKDKRTEYNIPLEYKDEQALYKYGFTDDLCRRFKEHSKTFGKDTDLDLFSYVDPKFMSQAEVKVKNVFSAFEKEYFFENHKELVILTKKEEQNAKDLFRMIARECAGNSEELTKQIQQLNLQHKVEIMEIKNELAMAQKENEYLIEKNATLIEKHSLELENKNLQIRLLQMEKEMAKN